MAEPTLYPLEFAEPAEFQAAWGTIVSMASCFVPGPQLPPQTPVVVEIAAAGLGKASLRGVAVFTDVDSWGRKGIVVSLDLDDLAKARAVFEPDAQPAAAPATEELSASEAHTRPGFATTMIKATPAPTDSRVETQPIPAEAPAPGQGHLEPGTLLDGRFQIEGHLATGGMGDVYRAAHVYLKRPIALKLLKRQLSNDPEMWARFQREAELVSQLENPHIVRVFDFGKTSDGQPFLAMEFVEGTTLDHVLARAGALRPVRAVDLVLQIAEGLEEAHARGIVHRDLKPPNIMIGRKRDGSEVAKILDFGIARVADSKKSASLTQLGMVVGTPAYLAPEQALADTLDARTDIYALGCVAYEMLTGRPPFVSDQLAKLVAAHLHEKPAPLPTLRPELEKFPVLCGAVMKALEKDRSQRFQDVATLMLVFARSVEEGSEADLPAGAVSPGDKPAGQLAAPGAPASSAAPAADAPSAFEDWPPPEPLPAPAAAPSAAEEVWPPPEPKPGDEAPQFPPQVTESQRIKVDDFFGGPQAGPPLAAPPPAVKPGPVHRLEHELAQAKVELQPERVKKLIGRRDALPAGGVKGVALFAEVTGAPLGSPLRARCTTQVVTLGAIHGGVLDHTDEDGTVLFFPGDEPFASAGRALVAAVAMREAVAELRAAAGGQPVNLRAAAAVGRAEVPQKDAPLGGELPARLRKLGARAQAGQVLVEKALARDLGDLLELREVSGAQQVDALEATERKLILPAAAQRLLGREAAMAQLDKRLSGLVSGTVAPVVVVGPSGTGKSALSQELALRARHQSFVVGAARGLRSLRGTPYAALAELLCNVCGVPKERRLSALRGALEKLNLPSSEIESALVVAGVQQLPRPVTPGQAVHTLRTVMATGAVGRRVVLIFDGLESLDRFSVDAFLELCQAPRPSELTVGFAEPAWAKERLPQVPTIELGALSRAELVGWLASLLPEGQPSERLGELLFARSRGNPGIALDWLHLLCDRGLLRQRQGVWLLSGEPPPLDDRELARERLQAMGAYGRRLFEAACIAGDAIDSQALAAVVPDAPPLAYQRVVASRLLRAVGGRRWAAASDRYLAAGLEAESSSRKEMHKAYAATLVERARAAGEAPDAGLVAEHLTLAGDGMRAIPIWRRAAEQALARSAPRDALAAFKGWADALGLMPSADGKGQEIVRARLDALSRAAGNALTSDDAVLARILVDDALGLARKANLMTAELQLMVARVLRSEARRARSAEALKQAEVLARGTPITGLCLLEQGEVLEAEGDVQGAANAWKGALGWGEASAELARWYGEVDFRAAVELRLAGLARKVDPPSAKRILSSALARLRSAQAPFHEARVLAMLGQVALECRELPEAVRALEESAAAAALSGDLLFQARQLLAVAQALAPTAQAEQAWKRAEVVRRLATSVGWAEGKRDAEAVLAVLKARQKA